MTRAGPAPFEVEWLGGRAEHYFRKVRPGADDLPWGTLPVGDYPPSLVEAARTTWTELAVNEYRAIVRFSDVMRAMALAKVPLDLLGMTGDFLADECVHVELASRMAMELGGGAPVAVDMDTFVPPIDGATPAFERASQIVLEVGISEAFAGGTGLGHRNAASHALPRAIFDRILADESRHRRFAPIYFEWAAERFDDGERARLAAVATRMLGALSTYWKVTPAPVVDGKTRNGWALDELHAVGWLEAEKLVVLAREVVRRDILEPLDAIGIVVPAEERERLLA
ncbi:MAG: hypothetical protein FWD17_14150 [Polyangiaceae bacterium]|nr:hypothetical protein [Polyangiaceae bacterium]